MAGAPDFTKIFAKFLATNSVVIADSSSTSRSYLANLLVKMGAKTTSIGLATNYNDAVSEIARIKPKIIICDYDLQKRCGLDLLQEQRNQNPSAKDCLFILVTGNTSQTAVARAAEEDVDTYIIKPFTADTLRSSILKAAVQKLNPSEYAKMIEAGKSQLKEGKLDAADLLFEKAKTLDTAPALAYGYAGQVDLQKKVLDEAQANYMQGLSFNKIHYKCLVGLYDVLIEKKRNADAYSVVKRISQYFPANPQRLSSVLRLAIITKSYDDIEKYYAIFTTIDARNEEMIRYVCAALVVCGKYYLTKNIKSRAVDLFQKATATSQGSPKILREIIMALCEAHLEKQAHDFLDRFPPDQQRGADYFAMQSLLLEHEGSAGLAVDRAREGLKKGYQDPVIYQVLIRCSAAAGLKSAAEQSAHEAAALWPKDKEFYLGLAATVPANKPAAPAAAPAAKAK